MHELTLAQVAFAVHGVVEGAPQTLVRGVATDSRLVAPGDLYCAIVGERVDGHDYIDEALRNGAVAALVAGFVVSFILINLLGEWVSKQIDNSAFGGFDRAVGLGFGVVRGLIVMGLFMLAFNALVPRSLAPAWITTAKLYPLANAAANMEAALAPKGFAFSDGITHTVTDRVKASF